MHISDWSSDVCSSDLGARLDIAWPAALAEDRFLWLAVAALAAGLVRGFSGFGAAMVFIPLAGIVVSPQTAVPLLFVADNLATLHITLPSFRRCCWAEILPLTAGATLTVPLEIGRAHV